MKNGTNARGYTYAHRLIREAELTQLAIDFANGKPRYCYHCDQELRPDQELHLDHTADRTSYRGLVHAACNSRDGANKVNNKRKRRNSRDW